MLAKELSILFIDADDHHPVSNIEKMSQGIPLNDYDREPWLDKLNQIALKNSSSGCVIACSALKERYRERLINSIEENVLWIYLQGTYAQIFQRMKNREDHFMDPEMLKSQFEALEEPANAIYMDISESPEVIIEKITSQIK